MSHGALVVISPHLDDAVFSNWSLMAEAEQVTNICVCAGVPAPGTTPSSHDLVTGSHDPCLRVKQRRQEDLAIAELCGWEPRHLDFLDAPYRDEPHDLARIADAIVAAMPERVDEVVIPAGVGLHPDHVASRDAALSALVRRGDATCLLYADLPYAAHYGWATWVTGTVPDPNLDIDAFYARALKQIRGWRIGEPVVTVMSARSQRRKLDAMRTYASQFPAMECGPSRRLSHPDRLPFEVHWRLTRDA